MLYTNVLELLDLCVKNKLLKEIKGNIFVYRNSTPENKEGWYLTRKDIVAEELMND